MRKIEQLIIVALPLILFAGCYDREIIDRKDFDHSLPKIENLSYTLEGNIVSLLWEIPENISGDFIRPLEVSVQVVENGIYRQKFSLLNEIESAQFPIDPNNEYRVIFKLLGFLTPDAKEDGFTDRVYSEGVTLEIK